MDVPWDKIITGALAALGMWCAPRVYRAARNVGKTKIKIAEERLAEAQKQAREAHANADPNDDATATAAVERARKAKESAEYWAALASSLGEDTKE